jgi:hypothetical protein
MRFLDRRATDDPALMYWLDGILAGVFDQFRPKQLYVLKVDNWFGKRWLGFSGKALGAFGVRKSELTTPPFIPSRIVSQHRFVRGERDVLKRPRIHVFQRSGENVNRKVEHVAPGATLFWYSGQSTENGRGSVMAYVNVGPEYWPWYVGVECSPVCRVVERVGITAAELGALSKRPLLRVKRRQ